VAGWWWNNDTKGAENEGKDQDQSRHDQSRIGFQIVEFRTPTVPPNYCLTVTVGMTPKETPMKKKTKIGAGRPWIF
jgi:hypothetical protein